MSTVTLLPDISEYQPNTDLPAIKRENGGAVIIRLHNGWRPDYYGARFRAAARKYRFRVTGLYQYLVPQRDVITQADEFCALIGKLGPGEFPVLDLEDPGFPAHGNLESLELTWCDRVESKLGIRPLSAWVYSYLFFIEEHGLLPVFGSKRRTWIADYSFAEPAAGHTLWQCTDGISGPHITDWPGAGYCDTNLFHGDIAALAELVASKPAPVPVPEPPSPDKGKDLLDMADFLRLIRDGDAIPLAAGQWTPLRFDFQQHPADPQHYRGDWRLITGYTGSPARVSGDVSVHLLQNGGMLDLRAVAIEIGAAASPRITDLGPLVTFTSASAQMAVNVLVPAGFHLCVLARSEHQSDVQSCTFSGFVSKEA